MSRLISLRSFFCLIIMLAPAHALAAAHITRDSKPIAALELEVARSKEAQMRGLMYRDSLAAQHGMLFLYSPPIDAHMWMKNTLIPLDMLFIDTQNRIVHIHRNAKPHDLTPLGAGQPVAAVIEINGGEAEKLGIRVGDSFESDPTAGGTK